MILSKIKCCFFRLFYTMKLLHLVLIAVPSLAHYHAPAQKCHLEWQEVVTPHCTTSNEQVHLKILLKSLW